MTECSQDRFQNICFVATGSPDDADVLDLALRLCERTHAQLSIVRVVEEPPAGILRLLASWGTSSETISGNAEASAEVQRYAEVARHRGVNARGEVLRGSPFLQLTRKVLRDEHDLLIKAAQPSQAVQRVLFGHTDRQLIRKCPCPVWIEKPSSGNGPSGNGPSGNGPSGNGPSGNGHERILAAVDPAPFRDDVDFDPVREELNTAILQFALLLAQVDSSELHVVHAWSFDLEMSLRSRAGMSDNAVAEVGESIRRKHEQALAELVGPLMPQVARVHLLKGPAGEEIARLAAKESIDVIVMGTMCRGGLGGFLIGNTAETVLDHVDCSVIALKPRGFVSPVQL